MSARQDRSCLLEPFSRIFLLLREQTKSCPPQAIWERKKDARWKNGTDSWSLSFANLVLARLGANDNGLAYHSGPSLLPGWSLQWPGLTCPAPLNTQYTKEKSEVNNPEPRWNLITKYCSKNKKMGLFSFKFNGTFAKKLSIKTYYAMLYASLKNLILLFLNLKFVTKNAWAEFSLN